MIPGFLIDSIAGFILLITNKNWGRQKGEE